VRVGVEALVGKVGVATSELWPEGQVKVDGEIWRARCDGGCNAGTKVVIRSVDGLTLVVAPE
jgi:membrane protein implicated in regulation of membrane protease activity